MNYIDFITTAGVIFGTLSVFGASLFGVGVFVANRMDGHAAYVANLEEENDDLRARLNELTDR